MSTVTAAKPSPISTVRKGVIQSWSRTLIPTAKEAPSDAESPSHKLLTRGGYIRRVTAGVYDYLPLAWRVLTKISNIVREEMDAAGASELFMPVLVPIEFYAGTKRDEAYGDLLFKLTDRKGMVNALGPTHEETITELTKAGVASYKQLPLNLYQIQTKFRDEARPRAGLLRGREFIMKDAYSFHMGVEGPGGLNEAYDAMYRAYVNIFTRCGLSFTAVEAESGPIGGSASHEFMVNCESGEDTVLTCPASGYAANVEKCEIGPRPSDLHAAPAGDLQEVHTPGLPGIDQVGEFMKVKTRNMLKTIVFRVVEDRQGRGLRWVLATVRGDHDVNEGKVKAASGCTVELAPEKDAHAAGFAIGYVSPRAAKHHHTLLLIDPDACPPAEKPPFWVTGSDRKDHHVKYFNWKRDVGEAMLNDPAKVKVADVRNALAGDPSPRSPGAKLEARRGIEVGHIFKLGTKYSEAMGFSILNEKQERQPVIMGCYGIGVSRVMAACVEMSHDENGIVWPLPIAPYHVVITPMKVEPTSEAMRVACELSGRLAAAGFDVLIDDRDERPGVRFKDADLIGVPIRLTIGDKSLAEQSVEFKLRSDTQGKGEMVKIDSVVSRCLGTA
ncbi:MAG: proline--tRNA ligase [Phycisphaerales bacterium]|nr:proline--tRNA ligase [Phycisphaerales bacterium]